MFSIILDMPDKYAWKSQIWDAEAKEKVIRTVRNEETGYLKASKVFSVP